MYSPAQPSLMNKSIKARTGIGSGKAFQFTNPKAVILFFNLDGFADAGDSVTIKVQVADTKLEPDWSAMDDDKLWTHCETISSDSQSDVKSGTIGIVKTGVAVDGNYRYEVNVNGGNWFNVEVTVYTAGGSTTRTVSAYLSAYYA